MQVVNEEPILALNSQLMWREYFYVMSVNNPNFDMMKGNPICLQIDWYDNEEHLERWKQVRKIRYLQYHVHYHFSFKNVFHNID